MPIKYDDLNGANAAIRAYREAFVRGEISQAEMEEAVAALKAEVRVILGLPALP